MRTTQFKVLEEVSLNNPIFIEALPGIGHVGQICRNLFSILPSTSSRW